MPVLFQCAAKPTPPSPGPSRPWTFSGAKTPSRSIHGRHDLAIIRRICPVLDSVTALVLCDLLAQRFGMDHLAKEAGL